MAPPIIVDECWRLFSHQLARAKLASDAFDGGFGLCTNPRKCSVTCVGQELPACLAGRDFLGYSYSPGSLELLGVRLDLRARTADYRRLDRPALLHQLRLIRTVSDSMTIRGLLVQSLTIPKLAWCSSLVFVAEQDLRDFEGAALDAVARYAPRMRARCLLQEVAGPAADVLLACRWRAIKELISLAKVRDEAPRWWRETEVLAAGGSLLRRLPGTAQALLDLGWRLEETGDEVVLKGSGGLCVALGEVSPTVIGRALVEQLSYKRWRSCDRIFPPRRPRQEENRAAGLSLPEPCGGRRPWTRDHVGWYHAAHEVPERRWLAIGAGLDAWFWNTRRVGGPTMLAMRCACGGSQPSASHVLWNCEARPSPSTLRRPADRSEDRLWLPTTGPKPAPRCWRAEAAEARRLLALSVPRGHELLVATDGGATTGKEAGWAAWSVCWMADDTPLVATGGPVPSQDVSSLRAELEALDAALGALSEAWQEGRLAQLRAVTLFVDCRTALEVLSGVECEGLWRLGARLRRRWLSLRDVGIRCACQWVPAHQRHVQWRPLGCGRRWDSSVVRDANRRADACCSGWLRTMRVRDARWASWLEECSAAAAWAQAALRWAAGCQQHLAAAASEEAVPLLDPRACVARGVGAVQVR
jgi:hypothetical protein